MNKMPFFVYNIYITIIKQKSNRTFMSQFPIQQRSATNIFMTDYLEYAKYTVEERAIPSLIDGLKPGQRKILNAALLSMKVGQKPIKMTNLVGDTYKLSAYHHGNVSLESAILLMGAKYRDTLAPLYIDGAGGSLRSYDAAAARYLDVALTEDAKLYLHDSEILNYKYDGDQKIEPAFFLPLLPMILFKRNSGMALGYRYNNEISYNPLDVTNACIEYLNNKKIITTIRPYTHEFAGDFVFEEHRWKSKAKYEIKDSKIIIHDLPVTETFASFEAAIAALIEKDTVLSIENLTNEHEIKYVLHVNKSKLERIVERGLHERIFHLACTFKSPNFVLLDENTNLILNLRNEIDVIKRFVDFRLKKYNDRKKFLLQRLTDKIAHADNLQRFIKAIIAGVIVLQNIPIKVIQDQLKQMKIDAFVLQTPVSKLTKEEYEKLVAEIIAMQKEYETIKATEIKTMYLTDLAEFKKKFENERIYN